MRHLSTAAAGVGEGNNGVGLGSIVGTGEGLALGLGGDLKGVGECEVEPVGPAAHATTARTPSASAPNRHSIPLITRRKISGSTFL